MNKSLTCSLAVILAAVINCKEAARPIALAETGAGNLSITLPRLEYAWSANDLGSSRQIQATVRNNSDRTYYANLGDGFNGSLDQDNLFLVGEGMGGAIEKFNPDGSWSVMPSGGALIEGTRFVALRPQKDYWLRAPLSGWRRNETGQFRLKVEYFDQSDPAPETLPKVDYSAVFIIK